MTEAHLTDRAIATDRLPTPLLTALFFLVGIVTRIPFSTLYCRPGDMGNFVLAMEQIDIAANKPQMPGMFVVFIYLGRVFDLVLDNPVISLVAVNILASGIAAAVLYRLGSRSFGHPVGIAAGLLTLTSPMVWFQGGLALSHMIEFCWVTIILAACYGTGLGNRKALLLLGFCMGIAGGIRPSTPFFMAPIAFFAAFRGIWSKRLNWLDFLAAVGLGLGAIALWLIPLVQSTGGWSNYWAMVQGWLPLLTERQDADSAVKALDNFFVFLKSVLRGIGLGMIPLLWLLGRRQANLWGQLYKSWPLQLLLLAVLPGTLFFLLVHLRRKEQVMTVIPAFVLLASVAMVDLGHRFKGSPAKNWGFVTGTIVVLNGLFFLFGPADLPTARNIFDWNADFRGRLAFVRDRFDPSTTAILTHPYNTRLGEVYFGDYREQRLGERVGDNPMALDPRVTTLVLLDNKVFRNPGQDDGFIEHELANGSTIRSRTWPPDRQLWVSKYTSGFVEDGVEQ